MKKRILIFTGGLLLIVAIVVVIICLYPYIRLKQYVDMLEKQQYSYNCSYYVELNGINSQSFNGKIKGYRDNPYTSAKVYLNDKKVTDVYVEDEGAILVNLKPLIVQMVDALTAENKKLNMLKYTVKNTYVSVDQCSKVLDADLQGKIDEAINCKYSVKKLSNPPSTKNINIDLKSVQAYKITTNTYIEEIIIVIGLNSEGETIGSFIIDDENLYLEAQLDYDTDDTDDISLPEESFSSYEISVFKSLYKMFK